METRVERPNSAQYAPILVGIFGSLIAGFQGLMALGHVLALLFARDVQGAIPDAQPMEITGSDYLRGAAYASLNLALAAVCIGAILVAVRTTRRGSTVAPWVCLGVVAVIALLTFTGQTWIGRRV